MESEHLGGYATAAQSCGEMMVRIAETLGGHLPPADVTQQQLRDRSWWSGPDLFVLIDDYDLVAVGTMNNPLAPIVEFLTQARDVGLRVILTRRSGGAGRAIFDPFIGRLKDLACNALVMSGSREEGALRWGQGHGDAARAGPPGVTHLARRGDPTVEGVRPVSVARTADTDSRPPGVGELNPARIVSPVPERYRVSVVGGRTQVDISLPADARVAEVLPYLSRLITQRENRGSGSRDASW